MKDFSRIPAPTWARGARSLAATALIFCLLRCGFEVEDRPPTGAVERAVLGGSPDAAHPYVAYLTSDLGQYCSAVLISPRWVVTAGHCIADIDVDAITDWSVGAELPYFLGRSIELAFNGRHDQSAAADPGLTRGVCRMVLHPAFGMKIGEVVTPQLRNDVALLELCQPLSEIPRPPLIRSPLTIGEAITLVGYGPTGSEAYDSGTRRSADNVGYQVKDRPYFSFFGPGNICPGDSGGAALVTRQGREELAGIISNGNCHWTEEKSVGVAQSVATTHYGAWIASIVDGLVSNAPAPLPGSADPLGFIGDPCAAGNACESGQCFTEADNAFPSGTCTVSCSRFCPDAPGKSTTFCVGIDDGAGEQGFCLSRCDFARYPSTGCREGYVCPDEALPRFNEPAVRHRVCVPPAFDGKADRGGAGLPVPGALPTVTTSGGCSASSRLPFGLWPLIVIVLLGLLRRGRWTSRAK